MGRKSLGREEVISRFVKTHGNKYIYSRFIYLGALSKGIITCKTHGDFEQVVAHHIKGSGCPSCYERKWSNQQAIKAFKKVHGETYGYSLVKYLGRKNKVKIICQTHGVFEQSASDHLQGSGCKQCSYRGWTKTKFKELCDRNHDGFGYLYVIRMYDGRENFFKVGITSSTVEERFNRRNQIGYQWVTVSLIFAEANEIYALENSLKKEMAPLRYIPKKRFKGYTECYSDIPDFLLLKDPLFKTEAPQ